MIPYHAAKNEKKAFQENQTKILEYSPNLNPTKNLRAIIKNWLRSKNCFTLTKFIEAVIAIWYHDE